MRLNEQSRSLYGRTTNWGNEQPLNKCGILFDVMLDFLYGGMIAKDEPFKRDFYQTNWLNVA